MILVVVGTRPELLKMAPVVKLAKARGLPVHVHCTMQSPDLVDRGILEWDTEGVGVKWKGEKPSFVVVQGDTRTAFSEAVYNFEQGVPVFHLEAGVRTYDLSAPWPEEGYRQMISRIATWHACTTKGNLYNLGVERINGTKYELSDWHRQPESDETGRDPAVGWNKRFVRVTGSPIVESVNGRVDWDTVADGEAPFALVTLHRRENRGHFADILRGIDDALGDQMSVMWYGHPNSWAAQEAPDGLSFGVREPAGPEIFATDLAMAEVVISDSGGVQEESNVVKQRVCVARTVTDRPESLGPKGGAILGGNTRESIYMAIQGALQMDRSQIDPTIFGDGKASERLVDWWAEILNGGTA